MNQNVLEVRGLSVGYRTPRGRVRALRDVALTVPRGQVVGIVGESGCGKSTLLNAIMGLLDANAVVEAGSIVFDGVDLLKQSPRQLQALRGDRLSMIFQDPMTTLNPVLTIGRQMTDIQYRQKGSLADKRRRSAEMLRRVGIADAERRLDNYPHQFSGGMCQRISIAMALQSEPDLLIADEPTTALDATLEVQILQRLRELQQSIGCSILFISHHLGVVAELCDFVTVMYAGEVVEQGSVRDIFHRARHPYAHKLLDCDPARIAERAAVLPTIPGDIPDLVNLPTGCIFQARCPRAMARCVTERPARHAIAAGHSAACHLLAQEMADG